MLLGVTQIPTIITGINIEFPRSSLVGKITEIHLKSCWQHRGKAMSKLNSRRGAPRVSKAKILTFFLNSSHLKIGVGHLGRGKTAGLPCSQAIFGTFRGPSRRISTRPRQLASQNNLIRRSISSDSCNLPIYEPISCVSHHDTRFVARRLNLN